MIRAPPDSFLLLLLWIRSHLSCKEQGPDTASGVTVIAHRCRPCVAVTANSVPIAAVWGQTFGDVCRTGATRCQPPTLYIYSRDLFRTMLLKYVNRPLRHPLRVQVEVTLSVALELSALLRALT